MFDNDLLGLNPLFDNTRTPAGVAPSRHALSRRRYLEDKRETLQAEAAERRNVEVRSLIAAAADLLRHILDAQRDLIRAARNRRRADRA